MEGFEDERIKSYNLAILKIIIQTKGKLSELGCKDLRMKGLKSYNLAILKILIRQL